MFFSLLANQPPPDFFHDPFWQFIINVGVAVVAIIVTTAVTLWIFRKQRSKKEISYQIISDAPIASVNEEFQNRVMIVFDGKAVGGVRQVVLKLRNSGNVAVKRDDYEEPIKLTFKGSLVLGSDILSTKPPNLINSLDKSNIISHDPVSSFDTETEVRIGKFLLNSKQSVTLTFLLDKPYSNLEVIGRIVDGEIVKYSEREWSPFRFYIRWGIPLVILGIIFSSIGYFFNILILLEFGVVLGGCIIIPLLLQLPLIPLLPPS